ncbi:hypothetical protein GCM10008018_56800 [Paenibacillus marchantiophytorum]|uniref:DUF3967 domain-containing protein n=1 Tax=Paenibacillus marchantiophytorum TaxID=1619310 RepID=A0ABQ1F8X0_9BACL|nr:hypothetical protein [Paenibacillus marchantiophytorum]GGA03446.1 hypothetical protein GCM10008018_56800 [Paenibacillus marchantiophytorum]
MKKEDLITSAELHALLAENGEYPEGLEFHEPIGAQHLNSLQKAIVLLSKQVEVLQSQLHEQFELQNRQQEQLLRQFRHQLENKLHEDLVRTIVVQQQSAIQEETMEVDESSELAPEATESKTQADEDMQAPYSRMRTYSKIRKRRKGFLEKLFE